MLRALSIALLLGLVARSADAQIRLELAGGYSLAHDPRDGITLPAGWMAGAVIGVTPALAIVTDVGGQYKTIPLLQGDARLAVHAVMGGVRASTRVGRLIEFAQIAAGIVRTSGSAFGSSTTAQSASVQPGLGVDYPAARALAVRAQFDVRLVAAQPDAQNRGLQYRFALALVYRNRHR
ncbi:MAG: hypothetical protein ACRD2I_28070 [Vicinamibacterales bacterium]